MFVTVTNVCSSRDHPEPVFLRASLWLVVDAVSPVRRWGFLQLLRLRLQLLLVPLMVRLLSLLLLLWLLLLWKRGLGERSLLLERESCLQNQLGRLVTVEKTSTLAGK